jgi:hypothetical protein
VRLTVIAASALALALSLSASVPGTAPRPAGHATAGTTTSQAVGSEVTAITIAAPSGKLSPQQLKALVVLCHLGPSDPTHFDTGVHVVFGPVKQVRLSPAQRAVFAQQWTRAVAASASLATPALAAAAGYVQAAGFLRGVGTHWIKWSLIGQPFDPAQPSMLLFDGRAGQPNRLVGFSYWVASDGEPDGFAGPNDDWHRHAGLCFTAAGWLAEEGSSNAACNGYWLNGQDLWMLHAWVVPRFPNSWGRFAPINPTLCPIGGPDILQCRSA